MSNRRDNPVRLRFWKGAYTVISDSLEEKLQRDRQNGFRMSKKERDHVEWRLGYNLYQAGRHFEAVDKLNLAAQGGHAGRAKAAERVKQKNALEVANEGKLIKNKAKEAEAQKLSEEIEEGPIVHSNYKVHRTAARCCVALFKATHLHYHLEAAHKHYENAIKTMPAGLVALFTLPPLLFEFGKMCEMFGAFQAALELYSKIITGFPNYRGYFDAMYRLSLCGRHIAEVTKDDKARDDLLNKSLDMLNFLLEAVPPSIEDTHIILLYSHALEISSDPALRFRAAGAFQSMHDYYKATKNPIAMTDKHSNFKDWYADPAVWLAIGDSMAEDGEPTLARDAYVVFHEKAEQMILFGDKYAAELLNADNCIRVAKAFAQFQSFERAVKFGELALKANRFHKETRRLMTTWSRVHATILNKEQRAVDSIEDSWRSRIWSKKFRTRLTKMIVEDNEDKLLDDHLDLDARQELAYYARDKWRATFLFEEECARRIQSNFREARKRWAWLAGIRAKYVRLASEAYNAFFKKPMNAAVRKQVRTVAASRFCPQKHALPRLIPLLDQQDAAVLCIRRSYMAYRRRKALYDRARQRFLDNLAQKNRMALLVQCLVRKKLSEKIFHRRLLKVRAQNKAATVIQKGQRKVWGTFHGAAWRLICRRRWARKQASLTIRVILWYQFLQYKKRKAVWLRDLREKKRQQQLKMDAEARRVLREAMAKRLQRFARACAGAAFRKLALQLLKERLQVRYSTSATRRLQDMFDAPAALCYSPPGIRQNTEQFTAVLNRQALCCSSTLGFDQSDCVSLSAVLKHRLCRCTCLVLHELDGTAPTFEFDLLSGISQCRALREIYILGGFWPKSFFVQLLGDIQIENPRVVSVHLEGVEHFGMMRLDVVAAVGRLAGDFFNYSLPGIREICLHGCRLASEDIDALLESLVMNTSITTVDLSLNLLDDAALLPLLELVSTRPKSPLRRIGFSWNQVKLDPPLRAALDTFTFPASTSAAQRTEEVLTVDLTFNAILEPYLAQRANYRILHVLNVPDDSNIKGPEAGDRLVPDGMPNSKKKPIKTLRQLRSAGKGATYKQPKQPTSAKRERAMTAARELAAMVGDDFRSESSSFATASYFNAWA